MTKYIGVDLVVSGQELAPDLMDAFLSPRGIRRSIDKPLRNETYP